MLNDKQKRFCDEYLIDLNATQAAIRAGYSQKTAKAIGSEHLTKPDIQAYLQKRMADRSARTEITQDMVLKELWGIAKTDIKEFLSFKEGEDGKIKIKIKNSETVDTKNVSEVSLGKKGEFKFKLYCRDHALVQVGRHLGMFTDKVEHSGSVDFGTFLQKASVKK